MAVEVVIIMQAQIVDDLSLRLTDLVIRVCRFLNIGPVSVQIKRIMAEGINCIRVVLLIPNETEC